MNQIARKWSIFMGMAALAALILGPGAPSLSAADEEVSVHKSKGKIQIVHVDEDGKRHEETIDIEEGEPRAFLGVSLDEAEDGGAVVDRVIEDSAAERAGLEEGDVIVGFDGEKIDDVWDLTRAVRDLQPGDVVDVEILRDGDREGVTVELGERASHDFDFDFDFDLGELEEHLEELGEHLENLDIDIDLPDLDVGDFEFFGHHGSDRPKLGVHLVEATPELREHFGAPRDVGVIVGKVLEDMPAEDAGIEVGDLIVSANGRDIEDYGDLVHVLRGLDGKTLELELIRDGRPISLDVFIPTEAQER